MPAPSFEVGARRQWLDDPVTATYVVGTAKLTGTLATDQLYSAFNSGTSTVYFVQGSASATATALSNPLASLERVEIYATAGSARIAVFSLDCSGTLSCSRLW